METWRTALRSDPVDWLLEPDVPAVRHLALRQLLDRPDDDPDVVESSAAAMASSPIAAILAAQQPAGYWEKPGPGYATKYRGTVWQLIFLDQLGAAAGDWRVRAACEYVLGHTQAANGGFGASGVAGASSPPPSAVLHCLNGNLLRALIAFGWLDDERVGRAIAWQAAAITGEGMDRWFASGTSGPGFACAGNEGQPCAWGALKALGALARVPLGSRTATVARAIETGVAFLFSRNPADADYPSGRSNRPPSGSWFKLGFPIAYVSDILENLQVLADLGFATDPRLGRATDWLLAGQDGLGRWSNDHPWPGKMWVDIDVRGRPSKWVTLRACRYLRAALG
jgi:hypothetical protein